MAPVLKTGEPKGFVSSSLTLSARGIMKEETAAAIGLLKLAGVEVEVDPSNGYADVFIATLPNGDQYEFMEAGLLKLKAEKKLNVAGIEAAAKKK